MIYYTEPVIIKELPEFLPIKKISFELKFSEYPSKNIQGVTLIPSYPLYKIQNAYLIIKIDEVFIKKIKLEVSTKKFVKHKKIYLKSTISETCKDKEKICDFDLKIKIYTIDKKTNRAILMDYNSIEEISKKYNKSTGYYIYRRSKTISKTSKETIGYINNPNTIKNKYVKKSLDIFKKQSSSLGLKEYPPLIYRKIIVDIFESFLKDTNDPEQVIKDIDSIFGKNLKDNASAETYAFYHIYEALVRSKENDPGYDKIQHFTHSAYLAYTSFKVTVDVTQYGAEAWDALNGGNYNDYKSDMYANNLGQAYGNMLYERFN